MTVPGGCRTGGQRWDSGATTSTLCPSFWGRSEGPRAGHLPSPRLSCAATRVKLWDGLTGQMAEQQTTPPPPAATRRSRPCARTAAKPSSLEKNGTGGGAERQPAHRGHGAEPEGPRASDVRSAKVNNAQGVLLPARAAARCRALTGPSQGSGLMKEIKEPTTTRGHCARL